MLTISAIAAATGLTLHALGTSLWAGWVPPNRWVGFRTPKTISDREVWYGTNRIAGRDLALGGALTALLALIWGPLLPAELPLDPVAAVPVAVAFLPVALAMVHSVWAVSVWMADRAAS